MLLNRGRLILLNEAAGTEFSRLITRTESGQNFRDGKHFLPWQACGIQTAVENPNLHVVFFLSFPEDVSPTCFHIAAGREVGRDLNWAGLSLVTNLTVFTYHVNFYD
jgi:hypothetical protein